MPEMKGSMNEIWDDAARQFQVICGKSLSEGDVKSFDDVRRKIESSNKQPDGVVDQENKWEKAKSAGLKSLKYMKILIGVAAQASTFIPIPSAAANIAGSALCFVFDIPERVNSYNDAVDRVFTDVSSTLSQFRIYESTGHINSAVHAPLVEQVHLVMVSMVRICAHVVKYRQGGVRHRIKNQLTSIFENNTPLNEEMSEFRRLLQAQRDVEGTVTLSVLIETQLGVAELLEGKAVFGKMLEDTQQGVQGLKDANDHKKALGGIRDALQLSNTVHLETRTTKTCTDIANKCLPNTGSWIWTHDAFVSWIEGTTKGSSRKASNVLVVSGPRSSGKTLATARIIKHLEEKKDRTYVAHYFFLPGSRQKTEENTNGDPVRSALRYMAFQIARVDPTVRKALAKSCDTAKSASLLIQHSSPNLDTFWPELKIGSPGSGAIYYLVFDGIENLDAKDRDMLLDFIPSPKIAEDSAGRVRFLVSGAQESLAGDLLLPNSLRIEMHPHNQLDMQLYIEDRLNSNGLLQNAKPGSPQHEAKQNILTKLPKKTGDYSLLQFALDEVVRLLSSRASPSALDKVLAQDMSSHDTAIKALQRSLTVEEIGEVNELLRWAYYSIYPMTVDQLEAAMIIYTGTPSIALLQDIIVKKYKPVLKIVDSPGGPFVEGRDEALEFLLKEQDHKSQHSKDQPTISMTININNVDQNVVGHFLWDLAHKAIRDQFRFNFDAGSNIIHTSQSTIAVNEFEAHRGIVMQSLKYLSEEPREDTKALGQYVFNWLPHHLTELARLHDDEKGTLLSYEQLDIGQHLYQLFKDQELFNRHKTIVPANFWTSVEMEAVQRWLRDPAVVRRLPKQWREEVQSANPVRGYLKPLVKAILGGWLRDPTRPTEESLLGYRGWVVCFKAADEKTLPPSQTPSVAVDDSASPGSNTSEAPEVEWDRVSSWCQSFLGLSDSDLDSLWWFRIACVSSSADPKTTISLLQRALEKDNPIWPCNSLLAECHARSQNIPEATAAMKLALEKAESEPTPDEQDIMALHFRLGDFNLQAKNFPEAAKEYAIVSKSRDQQWAEKGQVACMKAQLEFDNTEQAKDMLQNALSKDDSEGSMVGLFKLIARDNDHNSIIAKMFTIAEGDPDVLKGVVAALERATAPTALQEGNIAEAPKGDHFAETESRGVLLYHRGIIEAYRLPQTGTSPGQNALAFWRQSRDELSTVGGYIAPTTKAYATTQLSKYYFDNLMTGQGPLEHMESLSKLAEEESSVERSYTTGYLAVLHTLRGDAEKARSSLSRRVKIALQVLSDDDPDNDYWGYSSLFRSLGFIHDFHNSAAALAFMGQPDLVTSSLRFQVSDINEGEAGQKAEIMENIRDICKDLLQTVKTQVPDSSQQAQRVEIAKQHIDALAATDSQSSKHTAFTLVNNRISDLQETYKTTLDSYRPWYNGRTCDGLGPPGTRCTKDRDSNREFFHCVYCTDKDFCYDCLKQLRESSSPSMQCGAQHEWIKVPRQGSDFYCGLQAKSVRVPRLRRFNEDEKVWEAYYPDEDVEELTLEAWTLALAKQWDISLEGQSGESPADAQGRPLRASTWRY